MKEISQKSIIKHTKKFFLEVDRKESIDKEQEKKLHLRKENFMQKIFVENFNLKLNEKNQNRGKEIYLLKISEDLKKFEIKNFVKFLLINIRI
jgi:hypothetical protein